MAKYHYKYVIQFESEGHVKYFDYLGETYSYSNARKYDSLKDVKKDLHSKKRNNLYKNLKILKYRFYEEEFIKEVNIEELDKITLVPAYTIADYLKGLRKGNREKWQNIEEEK